MRASSLFFCRMIKTTTTWVHNNMTRKNGREKPGASVWRRRRKYVLCSWDVYVVRRKMFIIPFFLGPYIRCLKKRRLRVFWSSVAAWCDGISLCFWCFNMGRRMSRSGSLDAVWMQFSRTLTWLELRVEPLCSVAHATAVESASPDVGPSPCEKDFFLVVHTSSYWEFTPTMDRIR